MRAAEDLAALLEPFLLRTLPARDAVCLDTAFLCAMTTKATRYPTRDAHWHVASGGGLLGWSTEEENLRESDDHLMASPSGFGPSRDALPTAADDSVITLYATLFGTRIAVLILEILKLCPKPRLDLENGELAMPQPELDPLDICRSIAPSRRGVMA